MENVFKKFANIKSFNDYLNSNDTLQGWNNCRSLEISNEYKRFTKTQSMNEATDLLLFGDKKLQKKIEAAGVSKSRINITRQTAKRQIYTSVVGCAPHVPNYIAGVPTNMINERRVKVRQKIVSVYYNMAVSGDVSADSIIQACANFISACMLIEAKGTRVNIYCGSISEDNGQKVGFSIKIKDSGQGFDTLKMAYPLAHPSMNRRHKFRFLEVTEGVNTRFQYGYGYCADTDTAKGVLKENGMRPDAVLCFDTICGLQPEQIVELIAKA